MTQTSEKSSLMTPDFNEPEIVQTSGDNVACDGGGGPLGHPLVYLPVHADKGSVDCPYCDRRYVRNGEHAPHAH